MGGHPGLATTNGIENVSWFRDRVIREGRYKLFVGTDRKPEKLVDVMNDPDEKTNLMGDPKYQTEMKRLSGIIDLIPEKDNNPIYTRIPDYPRYRPLSTNGQSQVTAQDAKDAPE